MKFRMVILIGSALLITLGLVPAVKAATFSDVFPAALSNYVFGGWQGPFGDGTAGRLFPSSDGTGIYMDATYNGYVWALRSSPEFTNIDMTMRFTLPTRDFTVADSFGFLFLFHAPTTPPSGSCPPPFTSCHAVNAQSGLRVSYHVGNNQLWIADTQGIIGNVTLGAVALNQVHEARSTYATGILTVYMDGIQLLKMQTANMPAGQIGFDTYRVDLIVNSITLVGTPTLRLSVSLTGNFDYLLQETVPIQIAALVTDASTGEPVSGANVTIAVADSSGSPVVPSTGMVERTSGAGIYVWTSSGTIQRLHLAKGVYLATVTAQQGGPVARAILSFHVDPPADTGPEPSLEMLLIMAGVSAASVLGTAVVMRRLRPLSSAS